MNHFGIKTNVKVTKFLITDTGSYNPMFRRPYETVMDSNAISAIKEKVHNANHITPQILGGLADRFVMPTAAPEVTVLPDGTQQVRQIAVPNGWDQPRLRFVMEVQTSFGTGGSITEVIQGYSDYNGVTASGLVDDRMEFHINSVLKIRQQIENTPFGRKSMFNIVDASHVLVDNQEGQHIYQQNLTERMRPEDMFSAIGRKTYDDAGTIVDIRTVHNNVPVFSRRRSTIPTNYLSDIMEGWNSCRNDPTNNAGDSGQFYDTARGYVANDSVHNDAFVKAIANIRNMPVTASFTFADLARLDPGVSAVTTYAAKLAPRVTVQSNFGGLSGTQPWDVGTHQTGMTDGWGAANYETQAATVLSNAVPGLMMDLALTKIHFISTNRNLGTYMENGTRMDTKVGNWESFTTMDMRSHLLTFMKRFELEIMNGLCYNNQMDYWVEMHADLLGETWIRISFMGHPEVLFNQPSFADALTVPILTSDHSKITTMAADIDNFLVSVIPHDPYCDNLYQAGDSTGFTFGSQHVGRL